MGERVEEIVKADYNQFMEKLANKVMLWVGSPTSILVHTVAFAAAFSVGAFGLVEWPTVLLVLTTIVSLEAIYLSLFIQMAVNQNTRSLHEVEEAVEDIEEDIDEIQEDVEDILEDVGEIQEDIEEIEEDIGEISEHETKNSNS